MAGIAWVNGRLSAPEEAAISPLDPGFVHGEGLFETMRAYGGRVFRLEQHLERLIAAAEELHLAAGWEPAPARERLRAAVKEAVAASGLAEASVRVTVTAGVGGAAGMGMPALQPTLVVLVRALVLPPREQYERGCRVLSVPAALGPRSVLRRVKSLNYLDKLLAQREAKRRGGDEAILADADGFLVEGAMRNLFAVVGGKVLTPPLSRGLLPGITRQAVLEVAGRAGLPSEERDIALSELQQADECFLTSSLAEILPVASVDAHRMGAAAPGPVTRRLTQGYRALVAEELGLSAGPNRSG